MAGMTDMVAEVRERQESVIAAAVEIKAARDEVRGAAVDVRRAAEEFDMREFKLRQSYDKLGQGHQQRDAAPHAVADLARPLRNGLLGGDVVGAGAVCFDEISMSHAPS